MYSMAAQWHRLQSSDGILLFGPLGSGCDNTTRRDLQQMVIDNGDNAWVHGIITELPLHWKRIATAIPTLDTASGRHQLHHLPLAVRSGESKLTNTALIPLVFLHQLKQYERFVRELHPAARDPFAEPGHVQETAGLCVGLLSALVVSSARCRTEFLRYTAIAARLALLIGMVIDADASSDEYQAMGIAWDATQQDSVQSLLTEFPGAYISVDYDLTRAAVTVPTANLAEIQQRWRALGIRTAELGVFGRFHTVCHRHLLPPIRAFCAANADFRLPDASQFNIPVRSNRGEFIQHGAAHDHALTAILTDQAKWRQVLSAVSSHCLHNRAAWVVSLGHETCVPLSIAQRLGSKLLSRPELDQVLAMAQKCRNSIAVIGMACKLPGAGSVDQFWTLLEKGHSQHQPVPSERFGMNTAFRTADPSRQWFGNFIDHPDHFDAKFFGKTPRESATTDPQQRQLLQVAYQALEQSGYFHDPVFERDVGVYVGTCVCDYEGNVAGHPPNAFTGPGNLRACIAGQVSHFFGWTGPSMTIDTACSSSTVAIHQACRALWSGECQAVLVGGAHIMTNPLWFHNMDAGSFLSPSGQSKPFSADADGYCRGEGVGAIFLKRMPDALTHGDTILACIAATAVQQNHSCTPAFVPNEPSLRNLICNVTSQAGLCPSDISVVEAHGTGTTVGDRAEYESICTALGGRVKPLHLGSVKGLVGHTECTSGMVSTLKVLLMIQKQSIPPQASFNTPVPTIGAHDPIQISTRLQPWEEDMRIALVSNYGASGCLGTMIITEPPWMNQNMLEDHAVDIFNGRYPFCFSARDDASLRRYAEAFLRFLQHQPNGTDHGRMSLANISFYAARQSNPTLQRRLVFATHSLDGLDQIVSAYYQDKGSIDSISQPTEPRSVILTFGGQVSTWIGLDRDIYQRVALFQRHLDAVDAIICSLGVPSIFPHIFEHTPILDPVLLQTMLFALQYSSARSWIDCGVRPVALVGHSFGELTALCVAQVLSLHDAIHMIVRRAQVLRDVWQADHGAMMTVEAQPHELHGLLQESGQAAPGVNIPEIACYNGPSHFTLAGSTQGIDAVLETARRHTPFSTLGLRRLDISHAFHCSLVDPIMPHLEESARGVTFHAPVIPLERATERPASQGFTARYVAEHLRSPVFFSHAIERLIQRYPGSVFLEAGSSSGVTSMARRVVEPSQAAHFQPVRIARMDHAWNHLVDATTKLWKAGVRAQFWAHHSAQHSQHPTLLLPPYQFEPASHWVSWKPSPATALQPKKSVLGWLQVRIDRGEPISIRVPMPSDRINLAMQCALVIQAIRENRPDLAGVHCIPQMYGITSHGAMSCDGLSLNLTISAREPHSTWGFDIQSRAIEGRALSTSGRVTFVSREDKVIPRQLALFERYVRYQDCSQLLSKGKGILDRQDGPSIRTLVRQGNQSAGELVMETKLAQDGRIAECFYHIGCSQMASNTLDTDATCPQSIEQWIKSTSMETSPQSYHVLAVHHQHLDLTDIFVFNPEDGGLTEVLLGVCYIRTSRDSPENEVNGGQVALRPRTPESGVLEAGDTGSSTFLSGQPPDDDPWTTTANQIRAILSELTNAEATEILNETDLADLGIDSLMAIEVAREITKVFQRPMAASTIIELGCVNRLVWHLQPEGHQGPKSPQAKVSSNNAIRTEPIQEPNTTGPDPGISPEESREMVIEKYVREAADSFATAFEASSWCRPLPGDSDCTVLVTGATGSLGSYIVASLAQRPNVVRIICLNRRSRRDAQERQLEALRKRHISLSADCLRKIRAVETNMAQPRLGLSDEEYDTLVQQVTHVVHNAWLMNTKWPIRHFEPELRIMNNLIHLAQSISGRRNPNCPVTFQLISSIATVGAGSGDMATERVPEDRTTLDAVMPSGYGEAKFACERILDATLHQHPDRFRPMVVRVAQIAGARDSGYWNSLEHVPFLLKSAQAVRAMPDLDGLLSWTPVNEVADTAADLLLLPYDTRPYPIYHVDHPTGQPWKVMIPVLADALGISRIVSYADWLDQVAQHASQVESEDTSPALLMLDFFRYHFPRLCCGGILLDTSKCRQHSITLDTVSPISDTEARRFVDVWREAGFLS